jgi:transposase-like protein
MVQVMAVSPDARREFERMARSSVLPHRKVVQAKALLALADGRSVRSTAQVLHTYPNTVAAWRDRFAEQSLDSVLKHRGQFGSQPHCGDRDDR